MSSYILIADDDEYLAGVLGRKLRASGIDVKVVRDGEEALRAISEEPPRLLLLDLLMPRVDGFGVLAAVQERSLNIPIIVLSNIQDPEDRKKALSLGATDYISKSDMDIAEVVMNVLKVVEKP